MALSAKWLNGDLIFYDGTQEVYRIKKSTEGVVVGESDAEVPVTLYGDVTFQDPTTVSTTGTLTLTVTSSRFQFLNTTGAQNILLPSATGETAVGIQYFIANTTTGGNDLTVYDGTSGDSVVGVISQYESGIFVNDGNVWKGVVTDTTG